MLQLNPFFTSTSWGWRIFVAKLWAKFWFQLAASAPAERSVLISPKPSRQELHGRRLHISRGSLFLAFCVNHSPRKTTGVGLSRINETGRRQSGSKRAITSKSVCMSYALLSPWPVVLTPNLTFIESERKSFSWIPLLYDIQWRKEVWSHLPFQFNFYGLKP